MGGIHIIVYHKSEAQLQEASGCGLDRNRRKQIVDPILSLGLHFGIVLKPRYILYLINTRPILKRSFNPNGEAFIDPVELWMVAPGGSPDSHIHCEPKTEGRQLVMERMQCMRTVTEMQGTGRGHRGARGVKDGKSVGTRS